MSKTYIIVYSHGSYSEQTYGVLGTLSDQDDAEELADQLGKIQSTESSLDRKYSDSHPYAAFMMEHVKSLPELQEKIKELESKYPPGTPDRRYKIHQEILPLKVLVDTESNICQELYSERKQEWINVRMSQKFGDSAFDKAKSILVLTGISYQSNGFWVEEAEVLD